LISKSGPAVRCLELFEQGRIAVAISKDTLEEFREVIGRSSLRHRFPSLADERVDQVMRLLVYRGQLYRKVKRHFEYPRDPDDEPYLNLAIEAGADFIVTRDNDLLDLMKWDDETGREFQKRYRWLRIADPVEFLKIVAEQTESYSPQP
jgi:putative PIN family toxin of toxin-antitoxin system